MWIALRFEPLPKRREGKPRQRARLRGKEWQLDVATQTRETLSQSSMDPHLFVSVQTELKKCSALQQNHSPARWDLLTIQSRRESCYSQESPRSPLGSQGPPESLHSPLAGRQVVEDLHHRHQCRSFVGKHRHSCDTSLLFRSSRLNPYAQSPQKPKQERDHRYYSKPGGLRPLTSPRATHPLLDHVK